jgi:hypothetical protein
MSAPSNRSPDVLSTADVAEVVGVSRQAVLRAIKEGRLRTVGRAEGRGGFRVERVAAEEWGARVTRRPGPAAAPPIPQGDADAAATPTTGRKSRRRTAGALPPVSVLDERLAAKVISDEVAAAYRAALLAEAASRRLRAEVEGERAELERLRVQTERRRLEIVRNRDRRDNNVRQIQRQFLAWLVNEHGWRSAGAESFLPLLRRVLDAFPDDVVAAVIETGQAVQKTFALSINAYRERTAGPDPVSGDAANAFVREWTASLRAALEHSRDSGPATGPGAAGRGPK